MLPAQPSLSLSGAELSWRRAFVARDHVASIRSVDEQVKVVIVQAVVDDRVA